MYVGRNGRQAGDPAGHAATLALGGREEGTVPGSRGQAPGSQSWCSHQAA